MDIRLPLEMLVEMMQLALARSHQLARPTPSGDEEENDLDVIILAKAKPKAK